MSVVHLDRYRPSAAAGPAAYTIPRRDVRVIYIMGYGHSGSTILNAMLAEADGVVGIGELASVGLPGWNESEKEVCACGAPVKDCAFWSAVGGTWLGRTGERDFAALTDLREHLRRWRERRATGPWSDAACADSARFGGLLRSLYDSIAEVSGRRVIVDASKSVWRASFLSRTPGLDLRVIHLVRDSRAVAWSLLRRRGTSAARTAIAWRFNNLACDGVRKTLPDGHACLVRYEDLVFHTAETLARIEKCVGVDLSRLAGRLSRAEPIRFRHEVGGNHVRRTRVVHLKPDVAWTRDMPRLSQRLVWLLNRSMLRDYGYALQP